MTKALTKAFQSECEEKNKKREKEQHKNRRSIFEGASVHDGTEREAHD